MTLKLTALSLQLITSLILNQKRLATWILSRGLLHTSKVLNLIRLGSKIKLGYIGNSLKSEVRVYTKCVHNA